MHPDVHPAALTGSRLIDRCAIFRGSGSLYLIVLCLAALLGSVPRAAAQPGDPVGWKWLDPGVRVGFPSDTLIPTTLIFTDSLTGYMGSMYNGSFMTTDGGRSWEEEPVATRHDYIRLDLTFLYTRDGLFSTDNGATWNTAAVSFADESDQQSFVHEFVPLDRKRFLATYTHVYDDQVDSFVVRIVRQGAEDYFSKVGRTTSAMRLAESTDGGETWTRLDSLVVLDTVVTSGGPPYTDTYLHRTTKLGTLPIPDGMSDVLYEGWSRLIPTGDNTRFLISINASNTEYGYSSFLVRYNILLGTLQLLPRPGDVFEYELLGNGSILTLVPRDTPTWRSTDLGETWFPIPAYPKPDTYGLRFVTPEIGIGSMWRTTDGGTYWNTWGSPMTRRHSGFDNSQGIAYALDSTHLYVVNRYSHASLSRDLGKTWEPWHAGGAPDAIAAQNGNLVLARPYRGLFVSSDAGLTWSDEGAKGGLPADLSVIHAMAFVDTLVGPDRMAGVATFIDSLGIAHPWTIASSDAGRTWSVGSLFPILQTLLSESSVARPSIRFVPNADGEGTIGVLQILSRLYLSTDGGVTWVYKHVGFEYSAIDIIDSKRWIASVAVANPGVHGELRRTIDGGVTWVTMLPLTAYDHEQAKHLKAFNSDHYIALIPNYHRPTDWRVTVTTDGGATWSPMESGGGKMTTIVRWIDPERAYGIDREGRIYYSKDGGLSFDPISFDPGTAGKGALFAADDRYLYMAGIGNIAGRWELSADDISGVDLPVALDGVSVPNSLITDGRLTVTTPEEGDVTITMFDGLGRPVAGSARIEGGGTHQVPIDLSSLPSGRYFVRVAMKGVSRTLPVVVIR